MINYLTKNSKTLFLILTLLAGLFIFYPQIDYLPYISQGDHGRDLYAFSRAYEGDLPYQDYWWVYGPLMPYYYALFFKSLGVHVPALLTGKALLSLVSALLIYGTLLTATVTPLLALIGALWFLVFPPDFFITYNHTGGTTLLLALTFLVFQYLARPRVIFLYLGLGAVFFLSLVKLNFGVTGLFCLLVAVFGIDRTCKNPVTPGKKIFYWAALVLPFFVFLVYGWFLRGLPVYALRQCLPYFGGDQPYNISIPAGIGMLVKLTFENITATWQNILFTLVVVGATAALAALPLASPFLLVFVAFVALAIMRSWRRGAMIALIVTGTMLLVGGQAIVFVPVLILALPLLWWRSGFWTTAALGVMAYWAIKLFGSAWQLPILLVLAFSTFCWLGLPKPAAAKK